MAPLSREFSLPSSVFEDDETPTIRNGEAALLSSKGSASFCFQYEDDRRDDESSTESTPSHKAPLSVSFSEREPLVIRDIVDNEADFACYEKPNRWYARTDLRRFKEEALHAACMLDVHPSLFEKAHHTAVGLETKTLRGMTRKKTRRLVAQSSVFELQRRQASSGGGGASDPEAIAAAYGNYAADSRETALQRAEGLLAEESAFAKASTSHSNNNTTMMMFASNDNEVFVLKSPRENDIARSRTSKRRTRNSLLAEEKAAAAAGGGGGSNGKRNSGLIKKPRRRQRLLSILLGLPDRVGCLTAAQRTRYASSSMQFDASQIMRSATAIEI